MPPSPPQLCARPNHSAATEYRSLFSTLALHLVRVTECSASTLLPLAAGSGWGGERGEWEEEEGRGGVEKEVEKGEEIDHHPSGVTPSALSEGSVGGAALKPLTSRRGLKLGECLLAPFCLTGRKRSQALPSASSLAHFSITLLKSIKVKKTHTSTHFPR